MEMMDSHYLPSPRQNNYSSCGERIEPQCPFPHYIIKEEMKTHVHAKKVNPM
jgi:hypothetical protein